MVAILGIGWDVGGWMGSKQGIAACVFDTVSDTYQWIAQPTTTSVKNNSWTPEHIYNNFQKRSTFMNMTWWSLESMRRSVLQ